jgi:hypothetical protein
VGFLTGGLLRYSEMLSPTAVLFWGQNFAKFRPEKYDFSIYKGGFSLEKMAQIR